MGKIDVPDDDLRRLLAYAEAHGLTVGEAILDLLRKAGVIGDGEPPRSE